MTYRYNDININIEVTGEGEPVLLLHGWGCNHQVFSHIQGVLAQGYKVYNFDFPGFGASNNHEWIQGGV